MHRFLIGIVILGVVNFAVFFIVTLRLGGYALGGGYATGGQYFLASHGHYTQVTRAVFTYSRWHNYSLFITQPAAMLAGWQLARMRRS
ncbi:MAG: hypothetical protein POH28_02950 [Acidocella sp.]|nr:hypothetical protein [Acidocella sp.]